MQNKEKSVFNSYLFCSYSQWSPAFWCLFKRGLKKDWEVGITLFFKKVALLTFNPKVPNSASIPLFLLYLLPPSCLPLNCSSSLVHSQGFLLFLLLPQLSLIFCEFCHLLIKKSPVFLDNCCSDSKPSQSEHDCPKHVFASWVIYLLLLCQLSRIFKEQRA